MSKELIKRGKFVTFTYSIVDEKGNVVEQNDLPSSYIYGGEQELMGGIDRAMLGKMAGDKLKAKVKPKDAFGEHDPALTFTDDIENVPPQFRRIGAEVQMQNEGGEAKAFIVTKIGDGKVTVDGNHPLAGQTLTFHLNIMTVRDATHEDMTEQASSQTLN